MELRLKFYGTRGSIPVCHPDFQEFGGNTTCMSIFRSDLDRISILDAGTGIRTLGKDIVNHFSQQPDIWIGFTHFHWDHIQGFPFFAPAYQKGQNIHILALGKNRKKKDLKDIFAMQMQDEYFPVSLERMGANFEFLQPEEDIFARDGVVIKTIKQNHPGDSFGYRMEIGSKVLVICTDIEHGETINEDIVEFAAGADLLVHEAQYTDEELKRFRGWGHSSYSQAIEVAKRAGAKMLAITHHDPEHDDNFLLKAEKLCQSKFKDCVLAREGMEIIV